MFHYDIFLAKIIHTYSPSSMTLLHHLIIEIGKYETKQKKKETLSLDILMENEYLCKRNNQKPYSTMIKKRKLFIAAFAIMASVALANNEGKPKPHFEF